MQEFKKVVLKGEEYSFLSPLPIHVMDIEDECFDEEGKYDAGKFQKECLKMISKDLKVEDLISFNDEEFVLKSGEVLKPRNIGYDRFLELQKQNKVIKRTALCSLFLSICGREDIKLETLSMDELNDMAFRFVELFDISELEKAVEVVSTFL
jgi:hypothetical protein